MRSHRKGAIQLLILLVVVSLAATGCPRRPQRRPEQPRAEEPTIELKDAETGKVTRMTLEEYLPGVIAGEMNPNWPVNALAAQAIVARTYTLKMLFEGKQPSTSEEEFQAYNPRAVTENVRKAVRATRGEVMVYRGKAIQALFHSCSGGKTATVEESGLQLKGERTPYLTVVTDPPCPEKQSWTATFTADEIRAAAKKQGKTVSSVTSASIGRKGPSGRALTIDIGGTALSAPDLRTALDPERMRSTWITSISVRDGKVTMKGKGFGHGAGLSQYGALMMARKGAKPEEIVRKYFKGVELQKRWD